MRIFKYFLAINLILGISFTQVNAQQSQSYQRANNYPIVLLHGFFGWGRDELLGLKYWGGLEDIETKMTAQGFKTMTAVVGPFSSNWDRACELYAYIKGGRVDYGEAHATFHKHKRFGRSYPGIYPAWGEINSQTGKRNKIHIITHSQGGQTARMLVALLEKGHPTRQYIGFDPSKAESSPLFTGGHSDWVESVLTISSPHNGASLAEISNQLIPFGVNLIKVAGLMMGAVSDNFYDFKVDQWGVPKLPNENLFAYAKRFFEAPVWKYSKDTCLHDLTIQGSYEINRWVSDNSNVYYYSLANSESFETILSHDHLPKYSIIPLLIPTSTIIGSYTNYQSLIPINDNWKENDGICNTISMYAPKDRQISRYNGIAKRGIWNYLGKMENTNHWDTLGIFPTPFGEQVDGYENLIDWYLDLAKMLAYQR